MDIDAALGGTDLQPWNPGDERRLGGADARSTGHDGVRAGLVGADINLSVPITRYGSG